MDRIDRLTNLPPELREQIKARAAKRRDAGQTQVAEMQAKAEARRQQLHAESEVANFFRATDSITTIDRTPDGKPNLKSIPYTIALFADSKGNSFYLRTNKGEEIPPQDQLSRLSDRIKSEKVQFGALDPSTQARLQREGSAEYGTYLSNEMLRGQFQKLKSAPRDGFTI
ncbi:hypothetical protein HYU93_04845 [Candidatus Daviesbacteria bacterium]|nr:hypothetical protein [Candidatus Daviesbacteria bacterium]